MTAETGQSPQNRMRSSPVTVADRKSAEECRHECAREEFSDLQRIPIRPLQRLLFGLYYQRAILLFIDKSSHI